MACCNPIRLRPPRNHFKNPSRSKPRDFWYRFPQGLDVPCGYCLNCRVDRRNMWSDRAKWEYKEKLTASFVTVTYSDIWLRDKTFRDPTDGEYRCSLDYKDLRKFIHRVRSAVKYFYKKHPELTQSNVLMNPKFSYIAVGEYGENGSVFDRPHFHILFFGLDFAYCKKLFEKEWKYGIIDVLPLLDGGINYVLKYMDKEVHGFLAEEKYDNHFLARPRLRASQGFGANLYLAKKKEIYDNDMTYQSGHVRRPVPPYYIHKLFGHFSRNDNPALYSKWINSFKRTADTMRRDYNLKDCSIKAQEAFKLRQANIRERKLRQSILNDGVGVFDYTMRNYYAYYAPDSDAIRKCDIKTLVLAARDYRDSLIIGG